MKNITKELYLKMYRDMCTIRSFELAVTREFERGNVPGMLHTGLGQEAIQSAIANVLKKTDGIFPDHRCHGLLVLKGTPGEKVMAELFAKATGVCSGKSGPVLTADPKVNNFGFNGVEGSIMATALGVGLAWKMRNTNNVVALVVGDGTSGRGEWHESLNLAGVWKLPLLYCCVNNRYAISTAVGESHVTENLVEFAQAYKMPSVQVDGNDLMAAYEATKTAVDYIRTGKGPYFIEYMTWRWQGLFSGEFRPKEEVQYYKYEHDPIRMTREDLVKSGIADNNALERLEKEVDDEVESWIQFAKDSPVADTKKAAANVYVGWEVEV